MVSLEPSLLQAEQPQLSQPFLVGDVFQPSDHLCSPPLDLLQQVHVLDTPELDAVCQESRVEGDSHLTQIASLSAAQDYCSNQPLNSREQRL